MTTLEKVDFLIEGFNNFHNAIAYTSTDNSHIPFRFIITSPNHNASSHTVKIENDYELNGVLHYFETKLSKDYTLEFSKVDVRLVKNGSGYLFIQYLTV